MIYFCADDYGLNNISSHRILQCIDKGVLNKVSVFPNFDTVDLSEIAQNGKTDVCLHLNLVEGKCMSPADEIPLLADKNGFLKYTFVGLLKSSLLYKKEFESQVYKEIKTQIIFWKSILPDGQPFCIDSHQHTHMIPSVYKSLIKVLCDEKIDAKYMRIPAEPISPYVKTPSLYFTYSAANIIKQWLLKFLWTINKKRSKGLKIPTALFMGILFSGKMDEERVSKILPKYLKLAEKSNADIEVLFHPGYLNTSEDCFENGNVVFGKFYLSQNRKKEFDSVIKIKEGSVI